MYNNIDKCKTDKIKSEYLMYLPHHAARLGCGSRLASATRNRWWNRRWSWTRAIQLPRSLSICRCRVVAVVRLPGDDICAGVLLLLGKAVAHKNQHNNIINLMLEHSTRRVPDSPRPRLSGTHYHNNNIIYFFLKNKDSSYRKL